MTLVIGSLCAAVTAILTYIAIAGRIYRWRERFRKAAPVLARSEDDVWSALAAAFWPLTMAAYGVYRIARRPVAYAWRGCKPAPLKITKIPTAVAKEKK